MQPNDMYFLLDVTPEDINKFGPMTRKDMDEFILKKFEDQPLKYFNSNGRLKIFHPPSGLHWVAQLKVQFANDTKVADTTD